MHATMARLVTGTMIVLFLVACRATPIATVLGVTIDGGDQSTALGSVLELTATVETTGNAADAVIWTSSDETVATIDSGGRVTSLTTGTTAIAATSVDDPTMSDTRTVTVEAGAHRASASAVRLLGPISSADAGRRHRAVVQWAGTHDLSFQNPGWTGNPYDVLATATFAHATEPSVTTELFFNGGDEWVARFRGSALGAWSYTTSSTESNLDGHAGSIEVIRAPSNRLGPVEADGELLVRRRDNGAETIVVQPFGFDADVEFDHIGMLSTDDAIRASQIQSIFDNVQDAGMDGLKAYLYHNMLEFGSKTNGHRSTDPDRFAFQVVEEVLAEASNRGMYLHFWFWGDGESNSASDGLIGGINGTVDRRLQRYVAARLGPISGWIGAYGFDLGEWVTEQQVRDWASYVRSRSGWHNLLMARETIYDSGGSFLMGADKLDVYSNDDRPLLHDQNFYDQAVDRLTEFGGFPVMFERRFQYLRDGVWDAVQTRRSMWQFSIAGVGAVYGEKSDGSYPAADEARFRVHQRFWSTRHVSPRVQVAKLTSEYAMRSSDADRYVVYQENTGTVSLPLAGLASAKTAVAIDADSETYTEVSLGRLTPGDQTWDAPYASDWVVAVGFDEPVGVDVERVRR
jgi:hypothetical protein